MKTTKTTSKTNSKFKTRIIATVLAATCIFSTASLCTTTVSAATHQSTASSLNSTPSKMSSEFLSEGASMLFCVISESNPATAIIASGLFGAFKAFYSDYIEGSEPSSQEILDEIQNLSEKITDYHNAEMNQLNKIINTIELQNFRDKFFSIFGYNKDAINEIASHSAKNLSETALKNIIKMTIRCNNFKEYYHTLNNYVLGKDPTMLPALDLFLNLQKGDTDDSNIAAKQSQIFNKMFAEQYALAYTLFATGYAAQYQLAELQYKENKITKQDLDETYESVMAGMKGITDNCKAVAKTYTETQSKLNSIKVAEVTANGTTTSFHSFADAWARAIKSGDNATVKLFKNVKSNSLSSDVNRCPGDVKDDFYKGSLLLKNCSNKITLDLNGYSIVKENSTDPAVYAENSKLEIIDSARGNNSIGGINSTNANVTINGVNVKDGATTGVLAENHSTVSINNSTIDGYTDSGVKSIDSEVNIAGSTISNNSTSENGGGIYKKGDWRNMNISNSTISNNSANNGGGLSTNSDVNISNCTFTNNHASSNGGAVYSEYYGTGFTNKINVSNCNISNNSCQQNGGGIYGDSMCYLTVSDTSINNNNAGNDGGGIFAQKGDGSSCDPELSGTINITNNTSRGYTSNVFLQDGVFSKCMIKCNNLNSNSRIGIRSDTGDKTLDVVKCSDENTYNNARNVFSYDSSKFHTHGYKAFWSRNYYFEIVRN